MQTHSWWAMVILIAVDATICASFAFAHGHVSLMSVVCPPAGARLPAIGLDAASVAAWVLSALLMEVARRWPLAQRSAISKFGLSAVASLALVSAIAAFATTAWGHMQAGLEPKANAWSATVMTLVGYQGLHVLVIALMAAYLVARVWSGRLAPDARATLDNTVLFWQYTALQGIATVALVQLLPRVMNG
ncbi:MAG: hypothetical protein H7X75_10735 [Burkholderiaceae bacterium]|nr:hypothetical protein [Burkholderiaceae bacterium]